MRKVVVKKKGKKVISVSTTLGSIDYDKLAEAIIVAQEKQTSRYSITREWLKLLVTPIFYGISIIAGLLGVVFAWQGGKKIVIALGYYTDGWILDACIGILAFAIGLFLLTVAIVTSASVKEVEEEKDINLIVAVFSGVVSFVALIVSFVALMQGVS